MRIIDADKLKERWTISSPEPYNTDSAEVLESIDDQPTIEAVPVVHGELVYTNDDVPPHCSICDTIIHADSKLR